MEGLKVGRDLSRALEMQLSRAVLLLCVLVAITFAKEADPCLAEDYAEQNCASCCPTASFAHDSMVFSSDTSPLTDGSCCAQGGYKKEGHG